MQHTPRPCPARFQQRDQDTKDIQAFDDVFIGEGRTIKKTTAQSPNLQAFVERVIQTLQHEVLTTFSVVNEKLYWFSGTGTITNRPGVEQ